MLVFLTGFMGAGKTTAGKLAATQAGLEFISLDSLIEVKTGKSVSDIFSGEGEAYFRMQETDVLKTLQGRDNLIVDTGGGCACFNENITLMQELGKIIYISASHGILFHRLMKVKKQRPLIAHLSDVQLMEYIVNTLPVRERFYRQSDITIETFTETPKELAEKIVNAISSLS
jgi:shikimate kinase